MLTLREKYYCLHTTGNSKSIFEGAAADVWSVGQVDKCLPVRALQQMLFMTSHEEHETQLTDV